MGVESEDEDVTEDERDGDSSPPVADASRSETDDPDCQTEDDASAEAVQNVLESDDVVFVDELNAEIDAVIDAATQLRYDYVVGDVSDRSVSSSGNLYFDLVHEGSSITCLVYGFRRERLADPVEDGSQVAVQGDVSYYPPRGSLSIVVEDVVAVGEGVYHRTYRQNREILQSDGLLDEDTKRSLPAYPRCLGVVTSLESDAREDVQTSVQTRHPGVDLVLRDATVQGEAAMPSMMQAIGELDTNGHVDVIVLTRGGGADADLRVFNETPLCRVIANTRTPIAVAVGHENDRTLAGEVADHRAMTPTHAGEVVPRKTDLDEFLEATANRLDDAYGRLVADAIQADRRRLDDALEALVEGWLTARAGTLDHGYESVVAAGLTDLQHRLESAAETFHREVEIERERRQRAAEHRRARRRQQAVIVALVLLLLVLLAVLLL